MSSTSAVERRITLRLMAYWEKLRKDRPMPVEDDINPDDLEGLWDYCFLIHVKDLEKQDYNYTYLGLALQEAYEGNVASDGGDSLASLNASKLAGSFGKVIELGLPVLDEGQFINLHNDKVLYRQCLLPLGENGQVDAIFGGMRFKIYPSRS